MDLLHFARAGASWPGLLIWDSVILCTPVAGLWEPSTVWASTDLGLCQFPAAEATANPGTSFGQEV